MLRIYGTAVALFAVLAVQFWISAQPAKETPPPFELLLESNVLEAGSLCPSDTYRLSLPVNITTVPARVALSTSWINEQGEALTDSEKRFLDWWYPGETTITRSFTVPELAPGKYSRVTLASADGSPAVSGYSVTVTVPEACA